MSDVGNANPINFDYGVFIIGSGVLPRGTAPRPAFALVPPVEGDPTITGWRHAEPYTQQSYYVILKAHKPPTTIGQEEYYAGMFDLEARQLHLAGGGHQATVELGRLADVPTSRLYSLTVVIQKGGIIVVSGGSTFAPERVPAEWVGAIKANLEWQLGMRVREWIDAGR